MSSRNTELEAHGICKVSYILVVGGADGHEITVSKTGYLEGIQEWRDMSKAYYEDMKAGHKGRMMVIPKGVTLIALRLDNLPAGWDV